MHSELSQKLAQLAHHYNSPTFIAADPVQFPRRYTDKRDIEISAFVTAWISWGNRRQIIKTASFIDTEIFCSHPYDYLMSTQWRKYKDSPQCFYRTCRYSDFFSLMERLHGIYATHPDLEDAVVLLTARGLDPAHALSKLFSGISGIANAALGSPCKRLWFFLRWMVRRDGIVDLGIWRRLSPADLVIPLDTHVYHTALSMGITSRRTADIKTAREITDYFRRIFPSDPALGDFALFGYGEEQSNKQ